MHSIITPSDCGRSPRVPAHPTLQVQYRATAELKPQGNNPRAHSNKQIRQIASSIQAFGFNVPVLIDAEDHLITGHARLAACKLLNIEEVPTITLENLTPAQIRGFMIADNRR